MLEVEKRSLLPDEKEFERVKKYLDGYGKFLGKKELKSFLFLKPTYLRIRLVKGSNNVIITEKIGEVTDPARKEHEREIPNEELAGFLKDIFEKGYDKGVEFSTERYSYELGDLRVELDKISVLGLIVEVEALTEDEDEIPELENKIIKVLEQLGVKELDPREYKKMIRKEYERNLKKISEYMFHF
jgi:adenylate cyclase class 2